MLMTKLRIYAQPIVLFLALTMATRGAYSLEFSVHPNTTQSLNAIMAEGDVEFGDAERLSAFLAKQPPKTNTAVYLASPGGNLYEGMQLGYFFRDNFIRTVVEGGRLCASACALAFLGGVDNTGQPWRSSSSNSRLGFHAFSSLGTPLNEDEVQQIVADVLAYSRDVYAPLDLLILTFSTPSNEIRWLTPEEICALGIRLWSNTTNRFVC